MLSLILYACSASSDIAIVIFAYQVFSKQTITLKKPFYITTFLVTLLIYSFYQVNYLYIQLPIYVFIVIWESKAKKSYSNCIQYTLFFLFLNILLLPIINIVYYYLFNGFIDLEFSLFGMFTHQKLDFIIKMTLVLILFYIKDSNIDDESFEKKYSNYSYLFILICYIVFIVLMVMALSINNKNLMFLLSMLSSLVISLFLIFNGIFQRLYENIQEKNRLSLEHEKTKLELNGLLENQRFVDEMRKFKHDIKNNFLVINHMIHTKEFEAATKYLQNYIEQFESLQSSIDIDNLVVSAIINDKIRRYPNVEFDIRCFIPKNLLIDNIDLSTILGNILDNACEYVNKKELDETILVKITTFADTHLFIEISNPCHETELSLDSLKTTKIDKNAHGYGIMNVQRVVSKYHGVYKNTIENGMFVSQILIPKGVREDDYIKEDQRLS